MITTKTYRNYLIRLKDKMYKTLCLYEEESETFDKYLYSLVYMEIAGLEHWISELPHDFWYMETLSKMKSLHDHYLSGTDNHALFKSELFGINKLIDKQIDNLKGE